MYAGSAVTGAGVGDLMHGIETLLPAADGKPDAPPSGRVFKIERGVGGEKVAYVRMVDGAVRPRQRLDLPAGRVGKVAGIEVFETGRWMRAARVDTGEIGRLHRARRGPRRRHLRSAGWPTRGTTSPRRPWRRR